VQLFNLPRHGRHLAATSAQRPRHTDHRYGGSDSRNLATRGYRQRRAPSATPCQWEGVRLDASFAWSCLSRQINRATRSGCRSNGLFADVPSRGYRYSCKGRNGRTHLQALAATRTATTPQAKQSPSPAASKPTAAAPTNEIVDRLNGKLVIYNGSSLERFEASALKGKRYLAVYFSASWC